MGCIVKVRNYYTLTIKTKCPVDGSDDVYECLVESKDVVPVEKILELVEINTKAPVFQEHLTMRLAATLKCKVTTTGIHSGVKVVTMTKFPG
jgi:hypothetical protein